MSENDGWTFTRQDGTDKHPTAHGDHILRWVDGQRREWSVELLPGKIVLRSGPDTIELDEDRWQRDLYLAQHHGGWVIRFQTFDQEVGFLVSDEESVPFLRHLASVMVRTADDHIEQSSEPLQDTAELLWPRVSPLAVWALACSSLAFIPVIGLVPALATVVLLVLHRKKVRRARVMSHSRKLCLTAFIVLLVGLCSSGFATVSLLKNWEYLGPIGPEGSAGHSQQINPELRYGWLDGFMPERGISNPALAIPADSAQHTRRARTSLPTATSGPGDTCTHVQLAGHALLAQGILEQEHNWGLIAAGLIVILFSLTVHECAHGITAWWLGDDLARRAGRVTFNPMAHIDPFGTILLPIILFMMNAGVFGWAKPVPVRRECLRRPRRDDILVSIAGPGSNMILAAISLALLLALGCIVRLAVPTAHVANLNGIGIHKAVEASGFLLAPVFSSVCTVLQLSFLINVMLGFFNLIPIPPLDGSHVLAHTFPNTVGRFYDRIRPFSFLLILMLIYTDVLGYFFLIPIYVVLLPAAMLLRACTGSF